MGKRSINSFQNAIFILKKHLNVGRLVKMLIFSAIVNAKIANFIAASVKLVHFIAILRVWGSPSRFFLSFLLDCKMKFQHFAAMTSVL